MSLINELDEIVSTSQSQIEQELREEDVYNVLLNEMYENNIKLPIKSAVSSGKYSVEDSFQFALYMSLDSINSQKFQKGSFSNNSSLYGFEVSKDSEVNNRIFFRPLYTFDQGGLLSGMIIDLTPLGRKVFDDLQNFAQQDGVIIEPIAEYSYYTKGLKEKKSIYPPIGQPFKCHALNMSGQLPAVGEIRIRFKYQYNH